MHFYLEGYDAGDTTLSPCGIRKCYYKIGTFAYSEWWRGFCDSTEVWAQGVVSNV
jgi:hypothetical protein